MPPAGDVPIDHPKHAVSPPLIAAIALLFIGSGASALVYEVVWTRHLTTFFGASLYAVATTLSCFMGGLALGSWLLGKRADRIRKPLAFYGYLEIAIGVFALLFPHLLKLTDPIVRALYTTGGEGTFLAFTAVRFVLVFALLIVPTTMMGATLPVLSRALATREAVIGRAVGSLYALNTLGACTGVFLAGFVLIERFGVGTTTWIAAGVNALVGIVAIVLDRGQLAPPATPQAAATAESEPEAIDATTRRIVIASYGVSGFCALALQVCWTRALVFSFDTLKNTTYSFSSMLLVFLLGLTLGSALMQAFVDRQRNRLRLFALLQLGIGLSAALSVFLINNYHPPIRELDESGQLIWIAAVWKVLAKTAVSIGLPTLLMGMAFPVVARLAVRDTAGIGADVGRVYAANTLGAILGSFAGGFVLLPTLGIGTTLALLAAVYAAVAAVLFSRDRGATGLLRFAPIGAAACAVILFVRVQSTAGNARFQRLQPTDRFVYYKEGPLATVSVIEDKAGERTIYVDDVGVAGTDKVLQTDQKSLAHVPMMLLGGEAKRVLTVGFGAGGASWSYTRYPAIEEIHAIEISPEVLEAAPVLTAANHGIVYREQVIEDALRRNLPLEGAAHPPSAYTHVPVPGFRTFDPRYRVLMDDARAYLRFTETKYDVIATDCTDLRYKSNANLYDLEYFQLCRDSITDRGLVVVWMPLAGLSDRAFKCALRTFQEVFPQQTVWFFPNQPTHYCLLIGARGPLKIDERAVRRAVELPTIVNDLDEIGLRDPEKLLSCFVNDERTLVKHLGPGPLNTEDTPIIEFESPRYGLGNKPLTDNMRALFAVQVPVWDLIENSVDPEKTRERLWRLQQANAIVFEGHVHYRDFDFPAACAKYLEALALVPDDVSTQRLLDFAEPAAIIARAESLDANVVWLAHGLGSVFLLQKRYSDAVTAVEPIAAALRNVRDLRGDMADGAKALNLLLARAYIRAGQPARGERHYAEARRLDPSVAPWADFLRSESGTN